MSPLTATNPSGQRTRGGRRVLGTVTVTMLLAAAGCSSNATETSETAETSTSAVDAPTTSVIEEAPESSPAPTTTSQRPTLEERIAADMQGVQREFLDGFTTDPDQGPVFFHNGGWAAEALSTPDRDDFCERGTYTWTVVDATSESEFTLLYEELTEAPDCFAGAASTQFAVAFSGSRRENGRTVYDIAFTEFDVTGTRTVCSTQWDEVEACGPLPGFVLPPPPES